MARWLAVCLVVTIACEKSGSKPAPAADAGSAQFGEACRAYVDRLCGASKRPCDLLKELIQDARPTETLCLEADKRLAKTPTNGERVQIDSVAELLGDSKHLSKDEVTAVSKKLAGLSVAWLGEQALPVDPVKVRVLEDRKRAQIERLSGADVSDDPCQLFVMSICEQNFEACSTMTMLMEKAQPPKEECRKKCTHLKTLVDKSPPEAMPIIESTVFADLLETGKGLTAAEVAEIRALIQQALVPAKP